jgi:methyl-accepting chemotaxis protein
MHNLSLRRLLQFGIGAILSALIILAVVAYASALRTDREIDGLTQDHLPHLLKTQEIYNEANTIARALRNMQIIGTESPQDVSDADAEWARAVAASARINVLLQEIEALAKSIDDQSAFDDVRKIREKQPAFEKSKDKFKEVFDSGDMVEARAMMLGELRTSYNDLRDAVLSMTEQEKQGAMATAKKIKMVMASAELQILIFAIVGILLAIAAAYLLLKRVSRQLGGGRFYARYSVKWFA